MSLELERAAAVARNELWISAASGQIDTWLWDYTKRVLASVDSIAALPDLTGAALQRDVLFAAALFHATGWAEQVRAGQCDRMTLLTRPTSDVQRELAAQILQEKCAGVLPSRAIRTAANAIREWNSRETEIIEAQILGEAVNLDEFGLLYALRQLRHYQSEGRSIAQLLLTWQRQQEYSYWESRVESGFRFEPVRGWARRRLQAANDFMNSLRCELEGGEFADAASEAKRLIEVADRTK